jgi:hypothetical protein
MTHYVGPELLLGKAGVLIVVEADIRGLQFKEEEGRSVAEIEFLLVVAHRESGEFFRYDQSVTLRLRPGTRERLNRVWFPIARDFELQSGDHLAKIIVREVATGTIGSVVHEFTVPPLDGFRVTTPILSDTHTTGADGQPEMPRPLARREFPQGEQLLCKIDVLNARKDITTGMPRVLQGYQLRGPDGSVMIDLPPSEIQPTSIGALSRLFGFRLATPPGDYEIVMSVKDELSGQELEIREPFKVTDPLPASESDQTASTVPAAPPAP